MAPGKSSLINLLRSHLRLVLTAKLHRGCWTNIRAAVPQASFPGRYQMTKGKLHILRSRKISEQMNEQGAESRRIPEKGGPRSCKSKLKWGNSIHPVTYSVDDLSMGVYPLPLAFHAPAECASVAPPFRIYRLVWLDTPRFAVTSVVFLSVYTHSLLFYLSLLLLFLFPSLSSNGVFYGLPKKKKKILV